MRTWPEATTTSWVNCTRVLGRAVALTHIALPQVRGGGCVTRSCPSIRGGPATSDTRSVCRATATTTVVVQGARVSTIIVMSQQQRSPSGGLLSRQKFASALQVIRKNAVYRSIVMRLGHAAADSPKKCNKSPARPAQDDGGFGDWRTEGLPEHSHRRPSPPCAVSRSTSDHGVVRTASSTRRQHISDTKRVEEAYRRGFCDGSAADAFLVRRQQRLETNVAGGRGRRRPNSMDFADGTPWTMLSSSSTVPAGLGSKSRTTAVYSPTVQVMHRSLPTSASRFQRQRRLSLPVPAACHSTQGSVDLESPSATVPTRAAAIALHQLIECYRNGYRVTDHKIALMLDILDTQQRLAKVKRITISIQWFWAEEPNIWKLYRSFILSIHKCLRHCASTVYHRKLAPAV